MWSPADGFPRTTSSPCSTRSSRPSADDNRPTARRRVMGLIGGMARTAVVAGTATAVSNRVSRRQANRWAAQEQPQQPQQPQYQEPPPQQAYAPPPPPPPPADAPDMLEQLQ